MKSVRSNDWRGHKSKDRQIEAALYGTLKEFDEVERIFLIIRQPYEY